MGLKAGWTSVASSSDGTKLVAVDGQDVNHGNEYIYTSGDSGATWTPHGTQQFWYCVASSSDGTKLVAVVGQEGYIYTSSDSGATWNKTGTQQFWLSVASSANGTNLVAGSDNYLYTSSDCRVRQHHR